MSFPRITATKSYSTHQEYTIFLAGNNPIVTITPTPSVISRWISDVRNNNRHAYPRQPLVVGVGVQWSPFTNPPQSSYYDDPEPENNYGNPPPYSYYADQPAPENNYDPPADILQLCVGEQCLIIQLSHCDSVPDELRSFLTDPEATYVGIWNSQDAGKLERSRHRLEIGKLLDLRNYVQDSQGRSMSRCSFEEIVEECTGYQGVRLDREISMSDWSGLNLCYDQIIQASLDVFVCSQLGGWIRLWEV